MTDKITYPVLEIHARRIRELVKAKKYRNPDDFVRTAVEILLTWESAHPEECMELMKTLMPFSAEQESFMKQSMNPEELEKQFGSLEIDQDQKEMTLQKKLADTADDHLELRKNLGETRAYIAKLRITEPANAIPYDGHPLLSGFYSRILPVKIVLAVLANLLERSKTDRIELQYLRVHAHDIAEEIAGILTRHENEHDVPRNKKISTGLPKKGIRDRDEDKMAVAQKRFKDQYVGKVRKSRITKTNHFEGALSALGLVYAFASGGKTYVSLTRLGKEFAQLENPILEGRYGSGPLTKTEAGFVMRRLIPQRELEKKFVDAAISTVMGFNSDSAQGKADASFEKITQALDEKIRQTAIQYLKENPAAKEKYNMDNLESDSDAMERKIAQWRLATMGRLSEMRIVEWSIDERGNSVYLPGQTVW